MFHLPNSIRGEDTGGIGGMTRFYSMTNDLEGVEIKNWRLHELGAPPRLNSAGNEWERINESGFLARFMRSLFDRQPLTANGDFASDGRLAVGSLRSEICLAPFPKDEPCWILYQTTNPQSLYSPVVCAIQLPQQQWQQGKRPGQVHDGVFGVSLDGCQKERPRAEDAETVEQGDTQIAPLPAHCQFA